MRAAAPAWLGEEGTLQERSLLAENFRVCNVTRAPCVTVVSSTDPTRRPRASQGDPRATHEDRWVLFPSGSPALSLSFFFFFFSFLFLLSWPLKNPSRHCVLGILRPATVHISVTRPFFFAIGSSLLVAQLPYLSRPHQENTLLPASGLAYLGTCVQLVGSPYREVPTSYLLPTSVRRKVKLVSLGLEHEGSGHPVYEAAPLL